MGAVVMLVERCLDDLPLIPKPATIPCCRVDRVGAYGLFFANRPGFGRVAPGTNYLHAMLAWRALWRGKAGA